MKKLLSIAFALVAMFMITSCSGGPTGDPKADAKAAGDEVINLMKSVKSLDDAKNAETQMKEIQKKYEDFYKAKGDDEFKKFNDACEELGKEPEFAKKMEEAQAGFLKVMQEDAGKLIDEAAEKGKEALEDLGEKAEELAK